MRAVTSSSTGWTHDGGKRGGRELEAQTSLKRAALNLRHARDAFGRAPPRCRDLRPVDLVPGASGAADGPAARRGEPTVADAADAELDEALRTPYVVVSSPQTTRDSGAEEIGGPMRCPQCGDP